MAPLTLDALRIADHRALVDDELLERPLRAARSRIRAWIEDAQVLPLAIRHEGRAVGAVCLYREAINPRSARIELLLGQAWLAEIGAILLDVAELAFSRENIHRLEWMQSDAHPVDNRTLHDLGFRLDGLLRHALRDGQAYRDAMLWSILRSDFPLRQYAFVPFPAAIVAIHADAERVHEIRFLRYGEQLEADWCFDAAWEQGLVDRDGRVYARRQLIERLAEAPDPEQRQPAVLREARRQLAEYLHGDRRDFDFPIAEAEGTAFQREVWTQLRAIPYGQTRSYAQLARAVLRAEGEELSAEEEERRARALARAVGGACAQNPLAVVVPCHRVIGENRRLIGFAGGLEAKSWLLDLELVVANTAEAGGAEA